MTPIGMNHQCTGSPGVGGGMITGRTGCALVCLWVHSTCPRTVLSWTFTQDLLVAMDTTIVKTVLLSN